jgi:Fe-S-cluster containining protein
MNGAGTQSMECRIGCAACCIAPSISSSIPGMEQGKPAGVRCVQLTEDNRCLLFNSNRRPLVCSSLQPNSEICGNNDAEAIEMLSDWERKTCPDASKQEE